MFQILHFLLSELDVQRLILDKEGGFTMVNSPSALLVPFTKEISKVEFYKGSTLLASSTLSHR